MGAKNLSRIIIKVFVFNGLRKDIYKRVRLYKVHKKGVQLTKYFEILYYCFIFSKYKTNRIEQIIRIVVFVVNSLLGLAKSYSAPH